MNTIKEGDSKWNEREMTAECIFCGCKFSGTIKDGDFTVLTDDPKRYTLQATCPTCGSILKM